MKKKVKFYRIDVINMNSIMGQFKINGIQLTSIVSLLELKHEFSKISKESGEYLKQAIELLRPENFDEIDDKQSVIHDINKEYQKVEQAYYNEEIEIDVDVVPVADIHKIADGNPNATFQVIEFLIEKIGEK